MAVSAPLINKMWIKRCVFLNPPLLRFRLYFKYLGFFIFQNSDKMGNRNYFLARLIKATSDAKIQILGQIFVRQILVRNLSAICGFVECPLKIAVTNLLKIATCSCSMESYQSLVHVQILCESWKGIFFLTVRVFDLISKVRSRP